MAKVKVNTVVFISDIHAGCKMGLCPPGPIPLDDGGTYSPSRLQKIVWGWWEQFWGEWVLEVAHGEPYAVVVNGDSIDGVHHNATTPISHNLSDQVNVAEQILMPVVQGCEGRFYMIRGTEAHVGSSGTEEERLAKRLGAIKDEDGRYARYELWLEVGSGLIHAMHHIGTSGSAAYESTAVMRELTAEYVEAGKLGERPPSIVVRSHRHRNIEVRVPIEVSGGGNTKHPGYGIAFCTAGWQLKTPHVYKGQGRTSTPQIGGSIVRAGDRDVYSRHWVQGIARPKTEKIPCGK